MIFTKIVTTSNREEISKIDIYVLQKNWMMKDVCKRLRKLPIFFIFEVASFKISNPDNMGVNKVLTKESDINSIMR